MYCQNPSCMYYMLIFLYRFNSIILIIDFFNKYDSTLVYWLRVGGSLMKTNAIRQLNLLGVEISSSASMALIVYMQESTCMHAHAYEESIMHMWNQHSEGEYHNRYWLNFEVRNQVMYLIFENCFQ